MTEIKTYRIVFSDNTGSRAVDSIASTCQGRFFNEVQRYNGEHDLAFIEVPVEQASYLDEILECDENVISYQERNA